MLTSFLGPNGEGQNDHYLMTCEKWRHTYLSLDREELIQRFHLAQDDSAAYITYFGQEYRLDHTTGMVTLKKEPDQLLSFNTTMSIYNLFYYSRPDARISGTFVPFRLVKRAAPFDPAFHRLILKPLARAFSGRLSQLHPACRALGGQPIPQGDAGYVIHAFDCMPLTFVFWDQDEEFEAQANILFDADITDFIHEETVCCIASDLARRLAEEAGLDDIENLLSP